MSSKYDSSPATLDSTKMDLSDDEQLLVDYLLDTVDGGIAYLRAKNISDDIDLSTKQIGYHLPYLQEKVDELNIKKYSRSSSITWLVEAI